MNEQYNLENKQFLKILPFYNVLIDFVKSDVIKRFSNVKLMSELPFYKDLNVKEISKAFKRYAKSYKVEIVDRKDPMIHLYASKKRISKLLNELLSEMKGLRYQITLSVTLKNINLIVMLNMQEFILILLLKRSLIMILMMVLIKVLVKFYLGLITGSMRDQGGSFKC